MIERQTGGEYVTALAARMRPPAAPLPVEAYFRRAEGWRTDAPLEVDVDLLAVEVQGIAAQMATMPVTALASGGLGDFTWLWEHTGGDAISPLTPNSPTTAFSASGLAAGETRTATFEVTVTDELDNSESAGPVSVTITRWSTPALALQSSISKSGSTSYQETSTVTAVLTGGTAPFAIAWSKRSGGAIGATNPASLATAFSASGLAAGENRSAIFDLWVTDANGLQAAASIAVSISRSAALSVSVSPTSRSKTGDTATITTGYVNGSASGGSGGYSYEWIKQSGGAISALSASFGTTKFRATGMVAGTTRSATFRLRVTDSAGTVVNSQNVSVSITREAASGGGGGTTVTYNPAPGTYYQKGTNFASMTITASQAVTWTWTHTGNTAMASIASGGNGTTITFTLTAAAGPRFAIFNVTATAPGGAQVNFTVPLYASGSSKEL